VNEVRVPYGEGEVSPQIRVLEKIVDVIVIIDIIVDDDEIVVVDKVVLVNFFLFFLFFLLLLLLYPIGLIKLAEARRGVRIQLKVFEEPLDVRAIEALLRKEGEAKVS
jgi:hypothetical protein